jgi:Zn-dependent protease with chaperone function
VEDVARKLEVRPVDNIYVIPWAAISVNERGGILRKMFGTGKRNLLLGMAALQGLTQGQLAAILAHEYGHFSNRDTAGGNLAYQVGASLFQIGQQLRRSGAAVVFNPVWFVLSAYQRIFLRVTAGASRLQEILADRYAAIAYGSQNCIDGLKSMIRATIAFPLQANREVQKMIETKQPVLNLYQIPVENDLQGELEKQVEEVMRRPTGPFDSHPAPQERFALLDRLHVPYTFLQDNPAPALHLFPNPEGLQRELTAEIMKGVRISR